MKTVEPIIVSASRATDIPAFYGEWFIDALQQGKVIWTNPFNRTRQYVSFAKTKVIIFWSKNPKPFLKYLPELDKRGYKYYFQITLNDYVEEGLEPGLPGLTERIDTFRELSDLLGSEKVIWRFDPLMLGPDLTIEKLIDRIHFLASQINCCTARLIFSFVDIDCYPKVKRRLDRYKLREFSLEEKMIFAEMISKISKQFRLSLYTCAENISLESFGIHHASCVDAALIAKLFSSDVMLMQYLAQSRKKDSGQRKYCNCFPSKDIGTYNSCSHKCLYCYANN